MPQPPFLAVKCCDSTGSNSGEIGGGPPGGHALRQGCDELLIFVERGRNYNNVRMDDRSSTAVKRFLSVFLENVFAYETI